MAPAPENAEAIVARLNVILAESDLEETSIKDVHTVSYTHLTLPTKA